MQTFGMEMAPFAGHVCELHAYLVDVSSCTCIRQVQVAGGWGAMLYPGLGL